MPFDPTNKGTPAPFVPGVSHIIPNWRVTPAPVPATTLRDSASSAGQRQQTVAGNGSVIPILYGQERLGGQYAGAFVYGTDLYLLIVWCVGPVDSLVSIEMNDAALPGTVVHNFHAGTAGQTVDTTLQAALTALGVAYTDALPYICYSAIKVPAAAAANGFPTFAAVIKGMKVAATDGGTPAWSDNPVYCAADFVTSTRYGMGLTVDWATVATAATRCDNLIGSPTEKRRTLNLTMDTVQPVGAWLETLRAYCGCILNLEAGVVQFIPDAPLASSFSFTASNIVAKSLRLSKRGTLDVPTVVSVRYTNTGVKPYRDEVVTVYAAGVLAGSTPWRESQVPLPGVNRYSQARREAIERINAFALSDLTCQFMAFDPALKLQVGDVFAVTHPIGLTAKEFRTVGVRDMGFGRWGVSGAEYDAAVYSDSVVTVSSTPDTPWPSPSVFPDFLGLPGNYERFYQLQNGTWTHRVDVAWNWDQTYPFLARFECFFTGTVNNGPVLETRTITPVPGFAAGWTSPDLWGAGYYYVDIYMVSVTGARSAKWHVPFYAAGKTAIPGDVPTLTGFEAGGKVFLSWGAATDLDIWRYEIRYGLAAGSWETATFVDQLDALTYVANGTPAGDWRFYVKAIDSVRQYCTNAKTLDLTVTLDAAAFVFGLKVFDTIGAPTLTSMTAYTARPDLLTYYATDFGDGLGYGADNTDNAVGTFGDSLASTVFAHPHTAGTSKYVTQSWDMGQSLTGNLTGTIAYTVVSGSVSYWLETSPDNAAWTQWTGGTAKTTCRYVRLRLETTGTMIVQSGCSVRMDAYPREENGTITTVASGASTVTLDFHYAAANAIQLTPKGVGAPITARNAVYDNVVIHPTNSNTFDVYLFNSAGAQIAGDVSWLFQGI